MAKFNTLDELLHNKLWDLECWMGIMVDIMRCLVYKWWCSKLWIVWCRSNAHNLMAPNFYLPPINLNCWLHLKRQSNGYAKIQLFKFLSSTLWAFLEILIDQIIWTILFLKILVESCYIISFAFLIKIFYENWGDIISWILKLQKERPLIWKLIGSFSAWFWASYCLSSISISFYFELFVGIIP